LLEFTADYGKGILWLNILATYHIYGFFSAKPENNEEILQLKIPAVAKFNAKPIYCLFSVFNYTTYYCHFQAITVSCHSN